jgi:hypothetical protein
MENPCGHHAVLRATDETVASMLVSARSCAKMLRSSRERPLTAHQRRAPILLYRSAHEASAHVNGCGERPNG